MEQKCYFYNYLYRTKAYCIQYVFICQQNETCRALLADLIYSFAIDFLRSGLPRVDYDVFNTLTLITSLQWV